MDLEMDAAGSGPGRVSGRPLRVFASRAGSPAPRRGAVALPFGIFARPAGEASRLLSTPTHRASARRRRPVSGISESGLGPRTLASPLSPADLRARAGCRQLPAFMPVAIPPWRSAASRLGVAGLEAAAGPGADAPLRLPLAPPPAASLASPLFAALAPPIPRSAPRFGRPQAPRPPAPRGLTPRPGATLAAALASILLRRIPA